MKFKFGDRDSIILRNLGRSEAISKFLICPQCENNGFNHRSGKQTFFNMYINWKCLECREEFATDLDGVIFETNYDGSILKVIDRGDS